MPDKYWQDKRVYLRDSPKPIHRPSAYFIDLALSMIFENHASAHASMADDVLSKIAHEAIKQHESLILAQDERWRRA